MILAIDESCRDIRIGWYDTLDGEFGLYLGEGSGDGEHEAAEKAVHEAAEKAVRIAFNFPRSGNPFLFDSKKSAQAALKIARIAVKEFRDGRPWPAWATRAVKAGWSPPRGWKPKDEDYE